MRAPVDRRSSRALAASSASRPPVRSIDYPDVADGVTSYVKAIDQKWKVAGWGTWIRTKTNRVRVCCATVTPFPTEASDIAALFLEVLQSGPGVLQTRRFAALI